VNQPAPSAHRRQAAFAFIFVTVLLDMLAFGLIIPGFPHLIASFVGGNIAQATVWHGLFMTAFMLMQFVFSPVQGALSDHFGRRPVILASNLGLGLDFILMAVANTLPLLFIGRVLSGVTSASFSTANAYVADVTPPEKRAHAFGLLGMAFGIGFVVAPAIGGLLSAVHPRLPFAFAAGLSLANFCYGLFVLPESLPPEKRARFDWKRANPIGALALLARYPQVLGLAFVLFLMSLAHIVYPSTFVLYADFRFGWGPDMVGYTLAAVGALAIVVQGGLIRRIVGWIGERRAMLFGLACGALGFLLYGLVPNGHWFWAVMPIAALWGVATPAAQSIITRQVDPHEQGRLQGAITSLGSVAGIIGPTLFTRVFSSVAQSPVSLLSGATFYLAGAMVGLGFVVAYFKTRHVPPMVQAAVAETEPAGAG
jgi:DHA1 family tetracycline resistance protein-like MFS transporter